MRVLERTTRGGVQPLAIARANARSSARLNIAGAITEEDVIVGFLPAV
jgi:hypothetical protein